jgi:DNA-binding response OmpR family regulator
MDDVKILVIEDDPDVAGLVSTLLERADYSVETASDGRAGLRALFERPPDLVLLDVMLPEMDGWQVLGRVREMTDVPVLMLTARDTQAERVRGLRAGADDYVVKPFGQQELLARVEALLRRSAGGKASAPEGAASRSYSDNLLSIDFVEHRVRVRGDEVALTPLEFRLLTAFVQRPGQLLTHDELLRLVWGDSRGVSQHQVKLYVGYLRRKLDVGTDEGGAIETVRGFGYRYNPGA